MVEIESYFESATSIPYLKYLTFWRPKKWVGQIKTAVAHFVGGVNILMGVYTLP